MSNQDIQDLLEESKAVAELVGERLISILSSDVFSKAEKINNGEFEGISLPYERSRLTHAVNRLNKLVIELTDMLNYFDSLRDSELFYRKHIETLIKIIREKRQVLESARAVIREATRRENPRAGIYLNK